MGCCGSSPEEIKAQKEQKQKALDATILAKYLTVEQVSALADFFTLETHKPGTVLYEQGAPTDSLYVVAEGDVNLEVFHDKNPAYKEKKEGGGDDDEKEKIVPHRLLVKVANKAAQSNPNVIKSLLCRKSVGDFFGMRALLGSESQTFQAVCASRAVVLRLRKADWEKYLVTNSNLKNRILYCLGYKLEEALKGLAFLKDIDEPKLQLMVTQFRFLILEKDAELFRRGELGANGNGLHFLLEGQVKVLVLDEGVEKVVAVVNKGQFFGEVGLVVHLPRTATVVARKKCLFLELSQGNFRNFVKIAPEVLEAFKEKLEDYNIPLRYLIYNPILQDFFVKYLESEFSAENIKFWMKAKDFRLKENADDPDDVRNEAQSLYDEYVSPNASTQVNVNGTTAKEIAATLKAPQAVNRSVLAKAEEEVLALMGRDPFARFKSHKMFRDCLTKMTSEANYAQLDPNAKDVKKNVERQ